MPSKNKLLKAQEKEKIKEEEENKKILDDYWSQGTNKKGDRKAQIEHEKQIEKMQKLADSVDFETDEDYTEKLQVIKENYFPAEGSVKVKEGTTSDDSQPEVLTEEEAKEDINRWNR